MKLVALFVVVALAMIVAGLDRDSAEVTAKIVAERDAEVYALPLSHPLSCDATITTKRHDHERGKTRCYSKESQK